MPGKVLQQGKAKPYRPPKKEGWEDPNVLEEQRRRAVRKGFEEGYHRGIEQAQQESAARLREALEEIATLRRKLLEGLREEITDMTLLAAGRILRARVEEGDPVVSRVLAEALGRVKDRADFTVRLHPEDLKIVREGGVLSTGEQIELLPSTDVARGGVLIESGGEEIDARIGTSLATMADAIREEG